MKQWNRPDRITFVLRCWPEQSGQGKIITWRFALEDVSTRQQRGFAGMVALLDFLQNEFIEVGDMSLDDSSRHQSCYGDQFR